MIKLLCEKVNLLSYIGCREILYVWNTKKINPKTGQPVKNGHPDINVALTEMTSKREPINSLMWHAVENQSLYQAASYEYD